MITSDWSKYVPGESIGDWIIFLNDLSWNITIDSKDDKEYVYAGDHVLLQADTVNEIEALLFGMSVALAVLPDEIINEIKRLIAD